MKLICKHDPGNPDHFICEMKRSPFLEWLKRRRQRFYCVGPSCPAPKAYGHLIADAVLVLIVAALTASNLIFLASGRKPIRPESLEERIAALRKLPVSAFVEKEAEVSSKPGEQVGVLRLIAQARYFAEGEQLGRGPLPPKAGERTTYNIFLKLAAEGHAFDDIVVEGALGQSVAWTGFAPQGGASLKFEEASRTVKWHLGALDPAALPSTAVFEVAFTPSKVQVGFPVVLISNIVARGRDQVSGGEYRIYLHDLTTELLGDQQAAGKGIVTD